MKIPKHFQRLLKCLLLPCLLSSQVWALSSEYELGLKAYHLGEYGIAVRYFRRALDLEPTNPNVHYYLADTLIKSGHLAEAQDEFQTILRLAPDSQAARLSRLALANLSDAVFRRRQTWIDRTNQSPREVISRSAVPDIGSSGGIHTDSDDRFTDLKMDSKDGYLKNISENGQWVRWSVLRMPLKIYIEKSPAGIRNFEPGFIPLVRKAFEVWGRALNGRLTFNWVETPDDADIRIRWVNTIDSRGHSTEEGTSYTAGITLPDIRNDQLMHMNIKLATFDITNQPQNSTSLYAIAVHESGHALGLLGHSPNPADIMYFENHGVVIPSPRDLMTIRTLYSQKVDITSRPPQHTLTAQQGQELLHRMDEEIVHMEAVTASNGNHLDWLNLSTLYFRKGRQLVKITKTNPQLSAQEKAQDRQKADTLYQKSLSALGKSIQAEPKDPVAYYNRTQVYQEMSELEPALQDIERCLKLDPSEPQYYREKAWILAKMGRKAEAETTLSNYLDRAPQATSSPEVQLIRKKILQP